jgi:carbamoyltransferase
VKILGFSYVEGGHDTSAAIVCDGELVAAAEEERFTRLKHEHAFPFSAIEFCLKAAGITMSQVDAVAYADLPFRTGAASHHGELEVEFFKRLLADGHMRFRSLVHKRLLDVLLGLGVSFNRQMGAKARWALSQLRQAYGEIPPIRFYDHHRAHAAAAFFTSGVPRAAIATLDGRGGLCASATWTAADNRLQRIAAEPFYNSLGGFYSQCTGYLNIGEFAEGKAMGLASYGNKETYSEIIQSILDTRGARWYSHDGEARPEILGFARRDQESVVQPPYTDFAAAVQHAFEQAVTRITRSAIKAAQCADVCLGGGAALNCTSNGALLASRIPKSVWVFPATGDAGLSVGAALLLANEVGELRRKRIENAYWGPEFGPAAHQAALRGSLPLSSHRVSNVAEEVAKALAAGDVVGWFQGRMEFGPRALGNRSILADPRRRGMTDRVNKIKGREAWRPLSPVVLAEHAAEFFELRDASPFMLFATRVRPEKRPAIPAVVHVDGSARPQTVTRSQNQRLYDLLAAFSRHSGVPVLLNTSFNAAGEPIVCTPADAIKTFLATDLDLLVLGDYVVRRQTDAARAAADRAMCVSNAV